MIRVVMGKVGGGKTLYGVSCMVRAVEAGRPVWTNVHLVPEKWEERGLPVPVRLEDEEILRLWEIVRPGDGVPGYVVIDEAHFYFNARNFSDKSTWPFFEWLTLSRKWGVDVDLISQHPQNIDAQIRRQAEHFISCRDMRKVRIAGVNYPFKHMRITELEPDMKTVMESRFVGMRSDLWGLYDTRGLMGSARKYADLLPQGAFADTVRHENHKPKRKKAMLKVYILLFLVLICGGSLAAYKGYQHFRDRNLKPVSATHELGKAAPAVWASTPAPAKAPAYQVLSEPFLYADATQIRTASGWYRRGRMSPHGLVEGFKDGVVKIRTPGGGLLYLLTDPQGTGPSYQVRRDAPIAPSPQPSPTPAREIATERIGGPPEDWETPSLYPEAWEVPKDRFRNGL